MKPSTSATSSSESLVPTAFDLGSNGPTALSLAEPAWWVEPSDCVPFDPPPPCELVDVGPSDPPPDGLDALEEGGAPGTPEWPTWPADAFASSEFCGGMTCWFDGGVWAEGSGVTLGLAAVGLPLGVLDGTDESVGVGVDEAELGGAGLDPDGGAGAGTGGSRPGAEPEFWPGGLLPGGWCGQLGPDGVGEPGVLLPDPLGSVGVSVGLVDGVPLGGAGSVLSVGLQVGTADGGALSTGSPPGPGCTA